jgi:hypothetical protein
VTQRACNADLRELFEVVERSVHTDDGVQPQQVECDRRIVEINFAAFNAAITAGGSASTSTFNPTASAVDGGTVGRTSCILKTFVQSCSSPNVSKRRSPAVVHVQWPLIAPCRTGHDECRDDEVCE